MALKKVIVYFEDQQDALRFTLAAGSLISGEYSGMTGPLAKLTAPLSRAARITAGGRLGANSGGHGDLLEQAAQVVGVGGLDEVGVEAGVA